MKYQTIVIDPPWWYHDFATMPGHPDRWGHVTKRNPMPYASMTVNEIKALPVRDLAERDCWLYLWTTNRYLPVAFEVLDGWGFRYRQTLVWHKVGNPSPFGGTIAPNHAEFMLLASIGTPKLKGRWPGSVIINKKPYESGRKPEVFLDRISTASPGPYLEMFARRNRLGWDTWGNESLSHVEIPT